MPDGSCSVDVSDYAVPVGGYGEFTGVYGEAFLYQKKAYFRGYEDHESMTYNVVNKKAEKYDIVKVEN